MSNRSAIIVFVAITWFYEHNIIILFWYISFRTLVPDGQDFIILDSTATTCTTSGYSMSSGNVLKMITLNYTNYVPTAFNQDPISLSCLACFLAL